MEVTKTAQKRIINIYGKFFNTLAINFEHCNLEVIITSKGTQCPKKEK